MRASWKVCSFNPRVEEEILDLPAGLRMPHSRAMGRGLFELRLRAAEGIARILYRTSSDGRIVMLHQFIKKSAKTPRRELEVARLRMKEFQDV
jgi:phage-related protein